MSDRTLLFFFLVAASAVPRLTAAEREDRAVVWAASDGAGRVELLWSPLGGWPVGGFRLERLAADRSQVVADALRPLGDRAAAASLAAETRAELDRFAADLAAGGVPSRRAAAAVFLRSATVPAVGYAMGLRAVDTAPAGPVRYRLSGLGAKGEVLWRVETAALDSSRVTPAPPAPADLTADVANEKVRLRWTPPRGEGLAALTFGVERRVGSESRLLTQKPTVPLRSKDDPRHGFDDQDPPGGAEALYRVTLLDILGRPSPPAEVTVRIPDFAALAPPPGLAAAAEPGRIVLTWIASPAAGAAGYVLERALGDRGPFAPLPSASLPRAAVRYADVEVIDGTTYYYRLRSRTTDGATGDASPVVWAEARGAAPPGTPEGLAAEAGRTRVRLTWRTMPGAISGYLVERQTASGAWARLNPEYSAEPLLDDHTGPQDGAELRYRVRAVTHRGELSAPSETVTVRLPDTVPPPEPRVVSVRHEAAGLVLGFLPGAPATSTTAFRVLRSARRDGPAVVLGPALPASARSFADTSARPGETYFYSVLAADDAGNRSRPSEPLRATVPLPAVPAAAPPRVEARAKPFPQVRVRFPEPPPGLSVVVQRRVAGEPSFVVLGTLSRGTGEFVDASPVLGKAAEYRVAFRDRVGAEGAPSAAAEIVARKE
jgi:hypothetical protein